MSKDPCDIFILLSTRASNRVLTASKPEYAIATNCSTYRMF